MQELNMEQVQKNATEILLYVDEICRENNLNYSIYYGSLIGVERHSGFIPWDDDIDIVMLRPDYNKLLTILAQKKDSVFKLLSFETRDTFRYPFAKVVDSRTTVKTKQYCGVEDPDLGVFLDIFPIDGIPDSQKAQAELQTVCENYRLNMMDTLGKGYARSYSLVKSIIKGIVRYPHHRKLLSAGSASFWRDKYQEAAQQYDAVQSSYCGYMEFINREWGVFPTAWFTEFEDVDFEGHKVMAIKERKKFLTLRYGDYMQLPPVEERVTHHPYIFYRK